MPAARVGSVSGHIVQTNVKNKGRKKRYFVNQQLISIIEGLEVAGWLIWLKLTFV